VIDVVKLNSFRETLEQLYWMETQLEFLKEKTASFYIHNPQYQKIITKISNDSRKYREILENIIKNLKGIDLFWLREKTGHMETAINFNGLSSEEEIMRDILDEERKALHYYKQVYDETDKQFIRDIWTGDDKTRFFERISFLISEEHKHIGWLESIQSEVQQFS